MGLISAGFPYAFWSGFVVGVDLWFEHPGCYLEDFASHPQRPFSFWIGAAVLRRGILRQSPARKSASDLNWILEQLIAERKLRFLIYLF